MTSDEHRGRRRRPVTDEERALWRDVIRSVTPLRRRAAAKVAAKERHPLQHEAAPRPHPPIPMRAEAAAARRPVPAATPKPTPPLAPLDRRAKQRLARGTEPIRARIDLHGLTQGEAHGALIHFLRAAQAKGARFALVVTGKGGGAPDPGRAMHSHERGVLKRQVPHWLRLPEFRPYVVGFEPAAIGHGGEGAIYVRVRRAGERA